MSSERWAVHTGSGPHMARSGLRLAHWPYFDLDRSICRSAPCRECFSILNSATDFSFEGQLYSPETFSALGYSAWDKVLCFLSIVVKSHETVIYCQGSRGRFSLVSKNCQWKRGWHASESLGRVQYRVEEGARIRSVGCIFDYLDVTWFLGLFKRLSKVGESCWGFFNIRSLFENLVAVQSYSCAAIIYHLLVASTGLTRDCASPAAIHIGFQRCPFSFCECIQLRLWPKRIQFGGTKSGVFF